MRTSIVVYLSVGLVLTYFGDRILRLLPKAMQTPLEKTTREWPEDAGPVFMTLAIGWSIVTWPVILIHATYVAFHKGES